MGEFEFPLSFPQDINMAGRTINKQNSLLFIATLKNRYNTACRCQTFMKRSTCIYKKVRGLFLHLTFYILLPRPPIGVDLRWIAPKERRSGEELQRRFLPMPWSSSKDRWGRDREWPALSRSASQVEPGLVP